MKLAKVEVSQMYDDIVLGKRLKKGETFETDLKRAEYLSTRKLVSIVEIYEDMEETAKKTKKKAVKKQEVVNFDKESK